MTNEEIVVQITKHREEIGSLKHRMTACEEQQSIIHDLTLSVQKLALTMENMLNAQNEQGERLEKLEQAPIEDYMHYKRLVIGCILTGIVGAIVGAVFASI